MMIILSVVKSACEELQQRQRSFRHAERVSLPLQFRVKGLRVLGLRGLGV